MKVYHKFNGDKLLRKALQLQAEYFVKYNKEATHIEMTSEELEAIKEHVEPYLSKYVTKTKFETKSFISGMEVVIV